MTEAFYNYVLIEAVARTIHDVQQKEAIRQGNESPIDYNKLSEPNREYIRVVARFFVKNLDDMLSTIEFYGKEDNWTTIIEDKDKRVAIKDGKAFEDMGQKAIDLLRELGLEPNSGETK